MLPRRETAGNRPGEGGARWLCVSATCALPSCRGSFQAGMTPPVMGKLPGHTQVRDARRHARLRDDPLHAGRGRASDLPRDRPIAC